MKNKTSISVYYLAVCLYTISLVSPVNASQIYKGKHVLGRIEEVFIFEEKIKYKAKLDTGAKIASLLAKDIKEFEFDGKLWVSFLVKNPRTREFVNKEFPLERHVYIKQHRNGNNNTIKRTRRPIIMLPICLDRSIRVIEVNLVDRSNFNYPVLLGRDAIIQFNSIIDPSKIYTSTPNCEDMS